MFSEVAEGVWDRVVITLLKEQIKMSQLGLLFREKLIFIGGCRETAKHILKADVALVARRWLSPRMKTFSE